MDNTNAYIKTSLGNIYLKQGTRCSINLGIADIRDLSSRGGTFSKQLIAVWDNKNHAILGQLFDINATYSQFDINAKVECEVVQDDEVIVPDAYLQLLEINENQNTGAVQQEGDYVLLVKSAQRDLFTRIGGAELTDLDFTYLNHTYNASNVVASFTHTSSDGYVYPMGVNPTPDFLLTDFRPAIYVKHYFDQIHARAGFSYEVIDWDVFDKLVIPYNGDVPFVSSDFLVEATKSSFSSGGGTLTTWTEITDEESLFTPATGVYDVPVYLTGGQAINCEVLIDYDLILNNTSGANAYLVDITNSGFDRSVKYKGLYRVYKNGVLYTSGQFILPTTQNGGGFEFFESDTPIANGDNTIQSGNQTINIPIGNVVPTDNLTFQIDVSVVAGNQNPSFMLWKDAASSTANDVTVTPRIDVNDVAMTLTTTANAVGFGYEQDMNLYIPDKVKQKDFIKSVCNMAYLVAYPDPDNSNKIIYQPRDQYYDDGAIKNWTKKIDKKSNQLIKFLPELGAKRRIFTYKEDKDFYNVAYKDNINEVYGQAEFIFDTEFQQKADKLELIFSPTPMVLNNAINAIVPSFIGSAPKTNIRILIHNGTSTCLSYNIYEFATTGQTGLTSYPTVSHFDDHYNPTVDINFAVCDYYFYPGIRYTNNTLFNLHWRRTMGQMNSGKMLIAMFDLNTNDIAGLELNDKIETRNAYWNINRLIDYNANGEGLTKVELLSADDEIDLPSFRTKPVIPSLVDGALTPIKGLHEQVYDVNNINYAEGDVIVKGVGNVIGENARGMVVGDGGVIEVDGYYWNGERLGESDFEIDNIKEGVNIDSDYTIDPTSSNVFYLIDTGLTITLPDPDLYPEVEITIKDVNQGGNTLVASVSSIDTFASIGMSNNDSLTLHAFGGKWNIL